VATASGVGESVGASGEADGTGVDDGGGGRDAVALLVIRTGTISPGVSVTTVGGGSVRLGNWAVGVEYLPQRLGAGLHAPRSSKRADRNRMARLTAGLREDYNGRHPSRMRATDGQNVGASSA
jgi:hypothetical protein